MLFKTLKCVPKCGATLPPSRMIIVAEFVTDLSAPANTSEILALLNRLGRLDMVLSIGFCLWFALSRVLASPNPSIYMLNVIRSTTAPYLRRCYGTFKSQKISSHRSLRRNIDFYRRRMHAPNASQANMKCLRPASNGCTSLKDFGIKEKVTLPPTTTTTKTTTAEVQSFTTSCCIR